MARTKTQFGEESDPRLVLTLNELRERQLRILAADVNLRPEQLATVWLIERIDDVLGVRHLQDLSPTDRSLLTAVSTTPGSGAPEPPGTVRSLHEEIVEVLRESGPMSVFEIAQVVRARGQYRPPRSRRPISSATISRRVSNPQYRSLFARKGQTVGLAESAPSSK